MSRKNKIVKIIKFFALIVFPLGLIGTFFFHCISQKTITNPNTELKSYAEIGYACRNDFEDISECNRVLWLTGKVNDSMYKEFWHEYTALPIKPEYICFDSIGGSYESSLKIANFIAVKNIKTCMADIKILDSDKIVNKSTSCSSMCPYLLVSSAKRAYLGKNLPYISVHRLGPELTEKKCKACMLLFEFNSLLSSRSDFENIIKLSAEENKTHFDELIDISMSVSRWDKDLHKLTRTEISKSNIFNQ